MNGHKRFQAITHAYIETKTKNTTWRLITGKLYLGDIAQKYLIFRKKPQAAIKYEYLYLSEDISGRKQEKKERQAEESRPRMKREEARLRHCREILKGSGKG